MLEALSIEGLSNLYYLRCDNNSIVSLLGNLNNIMTLHCQNNLLSNLTVGTSSGLSELLCYGNPTLNIITLKAFTGFANIMQDTTNLPGGQIYLPISDMSKSGYTAFSTRVGAAGYTIFLT
jgi:Leucine-rich repeat (LRR) protein